MRIRFYEIFLRKQRKRDVTTALTHFSIRARIILEYFNVGYIFPVSYAISSIVSVREMQGSSFLLSLSNSKSGQCLVG